MKKTITLNDWARMDAKLGVGLWNYEVATFILNFLAKNGKSTPTQIGEKSKNPFYNYDRPVATAYITSIAHKLIKAGLIKRTTGEKYSINIQYWHKNVDGSLCQKTKVINCVQVFYELA